MPSVYDIYPNPTSGQGPYGLVPGSISQPPSTFEQTTSAVPGLGGAATTQLAQNIMSELQGQLSPQALKNMQDSAARFAVSSGMPGSNAYLGTLANNKNLLGNILTTQQIQQQGQKDYLAALQGIGQQQLSPALMAEIAAHNAQLRASPDPTAAANQLLNNYYNALNRARGPGAGTNPTGSPAGGSGGGSGALGFGFGTLGQSRSSGNQVGSAGGDINPVTGQPWNYYYDPNVNPETGEPWSFDNYGNVPSNVGYDSYYGENYYDPFSDYGGWDTSGYYDGGMYNPETGYYQDYTQDMNPEWDYYGG